jgi:hypothetical protein
LLLILFHVESIGEFRPKQKNSCASLFFNEPLLRNKNQFKKLKAGSNFNLSKKITEQAFPSLQDFWKDEDSDFSDDRFQYSRDFSAR